MMADGVIWSAGKKRGVEWVLDVGGLGVGVRRRALVDTSAVKWEGD